MSSTSPARNHPLLSTRSITCRIAELLSSARRFIAFARVSKGVYASVIQLRYRHIGIPPVKRVFNCHDRIPNFVDPENPLTAVKRRLALLKTLECNPQLGAAVSALYTVTMPEEEINRILAACPSLTSLQLQFPYFNPDDIRMVRIRRLERPAIPTIPSTVKRLYIIHDGLTQPTTEAIVQAFLNATSLQAISLCTTVETAQIILENLDTSRITRLNLCKLGRDVGNILDTDYNNMFACVPHLTSLRLYEITDQQVENISFPPLLQCLDFYTIDFKTIERIVELLASGPTWCPRLTRLARFRSIRYTDLLGVTWDEIRLRMQRFRENCGHAYAARVEGEFWQGGASEFETLAKRPRSFDFEVV